LREQDGHLKDAHQLLLLAASQHSLEGSRAELAWDYLGLASNSLKLGALADAQSALERASRLLPELPEPDRTDLTELYQKLCDNIISCKIARHKIH
jgi:hypothetical protein